MKIQSLFLNLAQTSFKFSLLDSHKKSLNLDDNVKQIRINREDLWNESIVIFTNPSFDLEATPIIKFEGESGIDAGWVRREFGSLLCKEIFSAKTNLFEGKNNRKLPIHSIDNMCYWIFQIAGKIVSYFIVHLGIGIPCLRPATYHYIAMSTIATDSCCIDDVVDLELKELTLLVPSYHMINIKTCFKSLQNTVYLLTVHSGEMYVVRIIIFFC